MGHPVHEVRERKRPALMVIVIPTSIAAALVTQCSAFFFCYFKALGNPYRLTILIQKKLLSNMYAGIKVSI